MGQPLYTTKQFIKAIPKSAGLITTIAGRVGCSWNTAKKYIHQHPTVLQAYINECETVTDMAESKLFGAMNRSEAWALKFYLSTKAKGRGYVQKQEVDVTSKGEKLGPSADEIGEAIAIVNAARTEESSEGGGAS